MKTIIVAKTIIFNEDGRLLRLRRSRDDNRRPGGTDLPGGKVDDGEAIVAGAVREIREESGLSLDPNTLRLSFSYCQIAYNADVDDQVNVVWLGFIAKLPHGQEVALSHEHQGYDWLDIDAALDGNDSTSLTKFIGHIKENGVAQDLWAAKKQVQ